MMSAELDQIIDGYRRLSTPNVSDALDRLQLQGAPHGIKALWPNCPKVVGPAATMKLVQVGEAEGSPVDGSLEAVMAARPGDVLVIDHGGRMDVNSYGGIVGFTTLKRGLAGCVIDGVARDVDEYEALGLPVYARGVIQQSIRQRCAFAGHGLEVQLAGVTVRPGDLIMGDANGIVVIPLERIEQVLEIASEIKQTEERIIEAIRQGMDPLEAHRKVHYNRLTSDDGP